MEEQIKQTTKRGSKSKGVPQEVTKETIEISQEELLEKDLKKMVEQEPIQTTVPCEPAASPIRKQVHYIVKERDSLEDIAERFNKTEAEIAKDNNLSLNIPLCAGTSLLIYLD